MRAANSKTWKAISLAIGLSLTGASVAVAKYLNFTVECHSSGGSLGGCSSPLTLFQGSILIPDNKLPTGTGGASIILSSATSWVQPNGTYNLNNPQYPTSIGSVGGNNQVSYTCTNGACYASAVNFTLTYGGTTFTYTGTSLAPAVNSGEIKVTKSISPPAVTDSADTNCVNGITGSGTGSRCNLANSPLSVPEIDSQALPRVALLLVSSFLVFRSRRRAQSV